MPHSTPLIATVVASLVVAFALGFVANRLRLPPLVGYLLAGVAIGPFTPGFVADADIAGQLAEIGVILLMFGVGIHFSLRDLVSVYPVAVPGALAQIAFCLPAGAGLGILWGWGAAAGLLLGLALSVASTVVLLRVLEERGSLDSPEGRVAVGWLIVQDIAMVVALVLLPALAGRDSGQGLAFDVATTLGKVAAFGALVIVVGRRAVPWLLAYAARTGSRELFTLAVLACALGIAFGSAYLFGVSLALGAFFAGVVLSESDLSHQAAADSLPLQDAFAVLFFVSVGMLFDPMILVREPLRVAAVLAIIFVVKSIAAALVMLVARQPFKLGVGVTIGLSQVGEFSFILAGLGVGLGVLPPEGRDLILAGALISIGLNFPIFAMSDRIMRWLDSRPELLARLDRPIDRDGDPKPVTGIRGHAVLVGHGRVGVMIRQALEAEGLPFVIVERDRRLAETLRDHGLPVVWGDAGSPGILAAAGIADARMLVLASPHGFQARTALAAARRVNSDIEIVVRTHSESELHYLERQGVGLAVMSEREMALTMAQYTLRGLGTPGARARLIVGNLRNLARVGTGEALGEAVEPRGAPELAPREPAPREPMPDGRADANT